MGIFDFERLFDLNHDGMLDPLEKGLEFTVIEDIMNDDEDNDDLFSSDSDDEFDTDHLSLTKSRKWTSRH